MVNHTRKRNRKHKTNRNSDGKSFVPPSTNTPSPWSIIPSLQSKTPESPPCPPPFPRNTPTGKQLPLPCRLRTKVLYGMILPPLPLRPTLPKRKRQRNDINKEIKKSFFQSFIVISVSDASTMVEQAAAHNEQTAALHLRSNFE